MKQSTSSVEHQDEAEIQRQRLIWLTGLRWYAAGGIAAATLIGRYLLGIRLPVPVLLFLSAGMFLYNYYYWIKVRKPVLDRRVGFHQIFLDVVFVTLTLFVTGGFLNPFFTCYFFLVIIAWIILSKRDSSIVTVLVTVGFVLQGLASSLTDIDMRMSEEGLLKMGELPFHVVGAPVSFILTTIVTAYFVSVIMRDLRQREREIHLARQQAELELNKLDDILRQLDAGMLVTGRDGRIEWTNDRIQSWFGPEGAGESSTYRIVPPHSAFPMKASSAKDRHFFHERRLPTVSEGVRDFEIVVTPVYNAKGELLQTVTLALDVTEQKKNQQQWAEAQKLAAIGQLAAGVAHEINTPLGTISILAQEANEILQEATEGHETACRIEVEESLMTIYDQTRRCKDITQGLLDFSRKSEPVKRPCSINTIVHSALELIRPKLTRIAVGEELGERLPTIVTDADGIERVLFNLLLNAADALEDASGQPCIDVQTSQKNGMISIRVSDNGPGIDERDRPHIFDPFFTTKTVGKGTGLGLYISYGTIRDLGGELEIDSTPGEGTQATIRLPIDSVA